MLTCLQPTNFSQWQLRHVGLWTRLRFLIGLSPSWGVRSRNTEATGLSVVTFTDESAYSFSGGISRTGHMGRLSTQYVRSSRLQRVYKHQLSLTDPRDEIVL